MLKANNTVYISGPMTDLPGMNLHEFFSMEATLRNCFGCKVLNPAKMEAGLKYDQYLEMDLAMVRASSHVVLLRGWEKSRGANLEKAEAEKHHKAVIHEMELMAYLTQDFKQKYKDGTLTE